MSQEVDLSTPLTADEFRYLTERSRGDLIERAHAMHGTSDEDYADVLSGDGTGPQPQPQPLASAEARAARREQLLRELQALDADNSEVVEEDEETPDRPYSEWSGAELDEELGNRGLPKSGSKADKVARLEADDAAA